jgi:hypothetical protein
VGRQHAALHLDDEQPHDGGLGGFWVLLRPQGQHPQTQTTPAATNGQSPTETNRQPPTTTNQNAPQPPQVITAVKWGGEGLLYSASRDTTVNVWSAEEGKLVRVLKVRFWCLRERLEERVWRRV